MGVEEVNEAHAQEGLMTTSAGAVFARTLSLDRNHGCGQLRCPTIGHFPSDCSHGDVEHCLTPFQCLLLPQPFFRIKPTDYDSEL